MFQQKLSQIESTMQNYYSPSSNVTAAERRAANRRRSSVMDYEQSLMFGQYREDLANFALTQAEKLTALQEDRNRHRNGGGGLESPSGPKKPSPVLRLLRRIFKHGGDMIFFSILAITLALLSFSIDIAVHAFFERKIFDFCLDDNLKLLLFSSELPYRQADHCFRLQSRPLGTFYRRDGTHLSNDHPVSRSTSSRIRSFRDEGRPARSCFER